MLYPDLGMKQFSLPAPLRRHLPSHLVETVAEIGWSQVENGDLLRAAEQAGGMPLHVLGFRRDALPLLRGLDMLFLTSDHEGTPMVVLEALALRVLVVARAVGGLPAVLGEGDHGVLIGSTEPAAWVDALRPFMLDPQLRSRLAERGFQAVSTQWSAAANARGYVQLYRECVGGR